MTAETPTQTLQDRLVLAARLVQSRRSAEAAAVLHAIVREQPTQSDALGLLGLALSELGDLPGAEQALSAAIALDAGRARIHDALARVYARTDRDAEAGQAFRAALKLNPGMAAAALGLSEVLVRAGRLEDALAAISAAATASSDLNLWTQYGDVLKALGRLDEAIEAYRRGTVIAPASGIAEHNLAAALGDAERCAEAEAGTRRAFTKGSDAPETWLVHGRALMGQAKLDEAELAFRELIRRRPTFVDPHVELAQLIWMRTADVKAASSALDAAILQHPGETPLRVTKAKLLEFAGDLAGAYEAVAASASDPAADPAVHVAAAQLAVHSDPEAALRHAQAAFAQAPDFMLAIQTLCSTRLAMGRPAEAAALALTLRERAPLDQHAIGLLATAYRMLGDDRYPELYDYERLVRAQSIDVPDGWPNLTAYLADLAHSLAALHPLRTHPLGQSLRGGTQTLQGLEQAQDPVIHAFFQAIVGPIRRYIDQLGPGEDPLRARRADRYRFNGVWSVRLRPRGFHADHLHPKGWISSACYVALPAAVDRGHEGWLKFGEPGVPTIPKLAAEHLVKPEPGQLVLFPSYMWHGTVPFGGDAPRLTIAFDVVPG